MFEKKEHPIKHPFYEDTQLSKEHLILGSQELIGVFKNSLKAHCNDYSNRLLEHDSNR